MAAIDRFEFLLEETLKYFSGLRDGFAVIGGFYASKRTLGIVSTFCNTIYIHLCSRISIHTDLTDKFGQWAVVTGGSEGIGFAYSKELAKRGLNIVIISRSIEKLQRAAASIVVTGSSEGIGRAYARELARRGFNVVLVSKPENRLYKAGRQIEEEYKVQTCCVPVDFSVGRETYNTIRESLEGKEIGVLVNNVGVMYDYPQLFLDVPEERLWQIVNINVAAATMMTHMLLPQMVERGKGAVVMVSSGACSHITPQMTVYAGTKRFLDYFAQALAYEYKDSGIVIQSLMPLYVNTKMTRYSNTLTSHSLMVPPAEVYAKQAVATLGYSARTTGYLPHTFLMWLGNMVPESVWMWGATRLNNALRRQAIERLEKKPSVKSSDSMDNMVDQTKSGKGAVVMVSSGACSHITPQMTVYAGTKRFLDYFAQALAYEYKDSGIVIQSLMPLYVNTKMTRYSNTLTSHSLMVPPAEVYAKQAVATLGYSARTTGYLPHTFLMWLGNMVPESVWMWGATRLNNALRRQAIERLEKKPSVKSSDSMDNMVDQTKS